MRKTVSLFTFILLFSFLFTPNEVFAKKKIITRKTQTVVSSGSRLVVKPRLRSDRRALIIDFSNLGVVTSFSYTLEYTSNGVPQGVSGTITPRGEESIQRELLFGTCSRNVCRYHTGIKNMRLTVTSTLKSGIRVQKSFRIKV